MKHLRRAVWFVAGRLLVLCLVLGILITVFYYAMNLANIQIILKDGMANRHIRITISVVSTTGWIWVSSGSGPGTPRSG